MSHFTWAVALDPFVLLTMAIIAGGAIWEAFRILRRIDRKFTEFQYDWQGTPERPGVPARPGVMERLAVSELFQADAAAQLARINSRLDKEEH